MGENNSYEIRLGIDLDTSDIQTQINNAGTNVKPIPIKVEIENLAEIKKQIQNLGGTKGKSQIGIPIDTASLESSLKDVSTTIKDIKASIGTIDNKSGMKSLLSSINQISSALEKASNQFTELNANLNALSGKDLSLNFGINLGSNNQIARNAAYGSKVRGETLPQLKQQVSGLVSYYNSMHKTAYNELEVLSRLVKGTEFNTGDFFTNFLYGKDSVASRMGGGSLSSQMQAYKEYIDMFNKAASLKGIDLSGVTSNFSKTADDLIKDAQDIQTGAKEMDESFDKLKQIFGGGINVEGLSAQLEPIIQDLSAIRKSLEGLSQGISFEGLTTSFDKLSDTLKELMNNAQLVQDVLSGKLSVVDTETGEVKEIQEVIEKQKSESRQSQDTANTVVQNEERKQQAYRETADAAERASKIKIGDTELDTLNINDDEVDKADRLSAALSKLKNIQGNIDNIKVGELDTSKGVQELQTLERQLESLSAEYNETVAEINRYGGVSATQFQSIQNQVNTTGIKLEQFQSKIADTKAKLAENIKTNIGTSIANEVSRAHSEFNKLSNKTGELQQKLDLLDNIKVDLDTAAANNDIDGLIAAHERYERILKDVKAQLDINKRAERDSNNDDALTIARENALLRLKNLFGENSVAAKKFGSDVDRLQREINECGNLSGIQSLNKQITNLGLKVKETGYQTETLGQKLKKQWQQYSTYLSVSSVIMWASQGLRDMFEQVKLIDSAMTELKKVTNETDASYNKFLSNAATRSKEIGTTIDGLVSSTADFARLGYGFKDAQGLAEVANIYAVVGDEIEGVEGATESLISTMAAFKDEMNGMSNSEFAMSIVDKFNEIGKLIA